MAGSVTKPLCNGKGLSNGVKGKSSKHYFAVDNIGFRLFLTKPMGKEFGNKLGEEVDRLKLAHPYKVKLRIADVVIQIQSRFPLEQLTEEEQRTQVTERFKNFFYKGKDRPIILIKVNIVDRLPEVTDARDIFITRHFQDGSENWRLCKKDDTYIYKSPLEGKKQLMLVNETFDKVTAYLLPKDKRQRTEVRNQKSEDRK